MCVMMIVSIAGGIRGVENYVESNRHETEKRF